MSLSTRLAVLAVFICTAAFAHKPLENDGSHNSSGSALLVNDTTVSQVVYEILPASEQLWLRFEGNSGETIPLQLGVPFISSLESYRPVLVLLGPGLPAVDVPFDVPAGLGGVKYLPVAEPEVFNEEFTGTESWILVEEAVQLTTSGTYYVVAYDPEEEAGKLWVAVGLSEVFGIEDFITFPDIIEQVRAFHEVCNEPMPFLTAAIYYVTSFIQAIIELFGAEIIPPILY